MYTEMCTSPGLRAVDRSREFLSGSGPGRPSDRQVREQCSQVLSSVDRPVDQQVKTWVRSTDNPTGHKNDCWLDDRSVDRQIIWLGDLPQTVSFCSSIKEAVLSNFKQDFGEVLELVFPSLLGFFSTCFWAKTSISKGEFLKSVFKRDFLSFHHSIYLIFSHKLELFHYQIYPIGVLL